MNIKIYHLYHKGTTKNRQKQRTARKSTTGRIATAPVSRAPVGFPSHPPSLSLVFQFSHSSAYARVFLSLFSLIGVFLFLFFSFHFFFFLNRSIPTKREICSANRKIRNNEGILLFPNFRFSKDYYILLF